MLQKTIKAACIVGIIAFLGQAALAPFYSTGISRVTGLIIFIGYATVLWSFMRRRGWSWLFTLALGIVIPIVSIFPLPAEKTYGKLIWIARSLAFGQALACLVILVTMVLPATKRWFRNERTDPNFHRGEQLEVSYQNGFWDLLWFNLYQLPRAHRLYTTSTLLLMGIALVVFSLLRDSEYSLLVKVLTYIIVVVMTFCGIAVLSLVALIATYVYRKIQHQRTRQNSRVSISQAGVVCESPSDLRQIKWSGIAKVRQSANYILLYLSDVAAFVIPKSAFHESSDAERFLSQSLQYWQNARNTIVPQ